MHLCWVGGDEHAVVVVRRAHVHASSGAAQLVGWDPSVLQGLPGHFEEDALLRVHVGGLERGESKEFGVEAGDVIDVAAVGVLLLYLFAGNRVGGILRPAAHGQRAGTRPALHEHVPEFGDVFRAREAAGIADDGDVAALNSGRARRRRAFPCHAVGGPVDQTFRQLCNRGVLIRHGGLEFNAEKVF